jgi:hypothetical protein
VYNGTVDLTGLLAMPVHDWTRVEAGTFHDFHTTWLVHLKERLNAGVLPDGYYAMTQQHAGGGRGLIADILTLDRRPQGAPPSPEAPVALAAPPRVTHKVFASASATYRRARRTLVVRHVSGHRVVALIEVLSPANKDLARSVADFVEKVHAAIDQGVHVLLADLFPPGPADPGGIHAAVWDYYGDNDPLPADRPLTLASYLARPDPEAYLEPLAVGDQLPDMPLFLDWDRHVVVPLEATYATAYAGVPAVWREVLDAPRPPAA